MAPLWDGAATYGPWILAVMGGAIAMWPPKRQRERIGWLGGFLLVAFLTAQGVDVGQRDIETQISGGDAVPIFGVVMRNALINPSAPGYPMTAVNESTTPLFDVDFEVRRFPPTTNATPQELAQAFTPIFSYHIPTLYPGGTFIPFALTPGNYAIQGRTRLTPFIEGLQIPFSGLSGETFTMRKFDGTIISCAPMPQCKGGQEEKLPPIIPGL